MNFKTNFKMKSKGVLILTCLILTNACVATSTSNDKEKGDPASPSVESASIWMRRATGALQCETGTGKKLSQALSELKKAGIKVQKSEETNDGMARMMVCGADTGTIHRVLISSGDVSKATKLGFTLDADAPRDQ